MLHCLYTPLTQPVIGRRSAQTSNIACVQVSIPEEQDCQLEQCSCSHVHQLSRAGGEPTLRDDYQHYNYLTTQAEDGMWGCSGQPARSRGNYAPGELRCKDQQTQQAIGGNKSKMAEAARPARNSSSCGTHSMSIITSARAVNTSRP